MEHPKSVGIWIRVSTEDQAKGESPEHHEKRARLYAESKGWKVETVYHLEAVSGKTVMEHPEAKRMISDVRTGKITGLIFSKLARLARNTRELLDFSDMFRDAGADLISLQESIDTSIPVGRLFYTIIAGMAEWEREEISSRVAASVPIRAKLGKTLGGAAPFGYSWEGEKAAKVLVINEKEAPIRKVMYELFAEHKRVKRVAKLLNDKGYRTRNGSKFTGTTVTRLLKDPMAKGLRRANYTKSRGEKKHWDIKPEEEWIFVACPAIVSEELWLTCNDVLDDQEKKRAPRTRSTVYLLSGFLTCGHCQSKMYVPSRTDKYTCSKCKKTRIAIADIEEIYFEHLKSFLLTKGDSEKFQIRANETLATKKMEMETVKKEKERIKFEMDKLIQLHLKDQIPTDSFKEYFEPLNTQYKQLDSTLATISGQLDYLKIESLNGDYIMENATSLYEKWPALDLAVKRQVVEEITESITIANEEITITFGYNPTLLLPLIIQNTPKGVHNHGVALLFSALG